MSEFILTPETYYTAEADKIYCSASQYLNIIGRPAVPGCEARAMAELNGEYEQETTKAMLIGSILDCLWELDDLDITEKLNIIADKFPECVSTRGATKGELKNEFKQAIQLYQRTLKDELFCKFMSGKKQVIMTGEIGGLYKVNFSMIDIDGSLISAVSTFGDLREAQLYEKQLNETDGISNVSVEKEIEGLPFKIKMDSYIPDVAIVDLKTTQDASRNFRKYIADSGNKETFYRAMGYDTQLAIYREIVRQNTGKTLRCYLACIDKNSHPLPQIIELTPKMLDDALASVKANIPTIKLLKSGEITNYVRCEECDYCRDTYKCKVLSAEEFETSDS